MQVTVCGPNLRDQSKGQFHVHAAGCADLVRGARHEPEYENGWVIEADTRKDVVLAIYDPDDFQYDEGHWPDYDDIHVFPCVKFTEEEA